MRKTILRITLLPALAAMLLTGCSSKKTVTLAQTEDKVISGAMEGLMSASGVEPPDGGCPPGIRI